MKQTPDELEPILSYITAILSAIGAIAPHGAPASALYASLSNLGCSMEIFVAMMNRLVLDGFLRKRGATYLLAVEKCGKIPTVSDPEKIAVEKSLSE